MKVKKIIELRTSYSFEAPFMPATVPAGMHKEKFKANLDLNKFLAPKPEAVYLVRVNGESMIDEQIYDGDILVVDKERKPVDGLVVIAALNGEMAVKTYRVIDGEAYLFSANKKFLPIKIMPFWNFEIQGVVRYVIHEL
ncbi:MAG: LexA family protein [Candidatus Kapaibacterium sp.]